MMRHNYFRVKNYAGTWIYGELEYSDGAKENDTINGETFIQSTLGQSTGFKDKNGTLIFLGDILKLHDPGSIFKWYDPLRPKNGAVTNVFGHWSVVTVPGDGKDRDTQIIFGLEPEEYKPEKYEVLGNVHDNGELLGGTIL